jgi:hypothetical protein
MYVSMIIFYKLSSDIVYVDLKLLTVQIKINLLKSE